MLNLWKHCHRKDAIQAGFEKGTNNPTNGLMNKLYLKDLQLVFRNQMSHIALEDFRIEATLESDFSHPMNSDIGSKAVAAVKHLSNTAKKDMCHGKLKKKIV